MKLWTRSLIPALVCLFGSVLAAPDSRGGDVGIVVKHGDLRVTGSDGDDVLTIDQFGPSSFRVQPGAGTTVNGVASAETFDGVDRDVKITLGEGANTLTIQNATLPRDLSVRVGGGVDKVTLSSVTVERHVRLALGAGNNEPTLTDTLVKGRLSIAAGDDVDLVKLMNSQVIGLVNARLGTTLVNAVYFDACILQSSFSMRTGSANDVINIYNSTLTGNCTLRLGNGANVAHLSSSEYFGEVREVCGPENPGYNTMTILNGATFHRDARFDFGGTGTTINATQAQFVRDWIVTASEDGGVEGMLFGPVTVGRDLRFSLGGGDNVVWADSAVVGRDLELRGLDGNDRFTLANCSAGRACRVSLGSGANTMKFEKTAIDFSARSLRVASAGDADTIMVDHANVERDVDLLLGAGDNVATLSWLSVGDDLFVRTGDGDDTVTLATSQVAGKIKILHGAGNDVVP